MKTVYALAATTMFFALLLSVYLLHVSYFNVDVVFYAALSDVAIAAGVSGAFLFLWPQFHCFGRFEKVLLLYIWLISGYALAISVPTVIDRSLSLYILEKLQQRGGGIREDSISDVFVNEYLVEHRLVEVRLTEQLASGTIVIQNRCVKLTKKGERLASFGRYFRQNWLPKNRLLLGRYSDELTDPFRNSLNQRVYTCD